MNASILLLAAVSIWRMGGDINVDNAPNGALLRTMGGNIRVARGAGKIVAKTMGGDIEIVALEGGADVGTMGGDVRVTVVGAGGGHELDLRSMGGEIELTLPRDFQGEFDVELEQDDEHTGHRITSDFPLQRHQSTRRRFFGSNRTVYTATGRSGAGTNRVHISTIGSDITIRRR